MCISELLDKISGCIIREKYHLYCPGCGGTRALKALLKGNLLQSLFYNPVVVMLIIEILIIAGTLIYEKSTKQKYRFCHQRLVINWILLLTIILNFVIKNFMWIVLDVDLLGDFTKIF